MILANLFLSCQAANLFYSGQAFSPPSFPIGKWISPPLIDLLLSCGKTRYCQFWKKKEGKTVSAGRQKMTKETEDRTERAWVRKKREKTGNVSWQQRWPIMFSVRRRRGIFFLFPFRYIFCQQNYCRFMEWTLQQTCQYLLNFMRG